MTGRWGLAIASGREVAHRIVSSRRWLFCIVAVVAVVFLLKITLALRTYGTNDVLFWEANLEKIRHDGGLALYRDGAVLYQGTVAYHTEKFNQPPFMVWVLMFWGWLADVSGLPFRFWLRLSSSVADVLSIPLLVAIIGRSRIPFHPALLLLVAASPVSVLVSGFHGNTDAVMMAFVLLSLYLLETGRPAWAAGAALGMAMNIKIVPVIFLPAICLYMGRLSKQAQLLAGAAAVFMAGSLPLFFEEPRLIAMRVFGYSPDYGTWGLSRLAFTLLPQTGWSIYSRYARIAALGLILAVSFWMNTRKPKPSPLIQFGVMAFLFLALAPGFGVQYLEWLVPWTVLLTVPQSFSFHAVSGALIFAFYDRLTGGLPWYLASVFGSHGLMGPTLLVGLLCWTVVCFLAVVLMRATLLGARGS